jgi:hypothetical protein
MTTQWPKRLNRPAAGFACLITACILCTLIMPLPLLADGETTTPPATEPDIKATPAEQEKALQLAAEDHVALLAMLLDRHDKTVRDYTGVFHKQERLKGKLTPKQRIAFKFRQKPFSIFMEWLENPLGTHRLLYVEGQNDGKMLAHPTGLLAFVKAVKLDPEGKQAAKSSLRPVTKFGFRSSLTQMLDVYRTAAEKGDLKTAFSGPKTIDNRRVLILERFLPKDKYENPHLTVQIDLEYLLPTQVTTADQQDKLISQYTWTDLNFNTNLTDRHFDPKQHRLD